MNKVMVDTNIFLSYFFKIEETRIPLINDLLNNALDKKIKLVITTRILDEIIFKSIILASGMNVKKLKSHKEIVKKYSYIINQVFNFIKDFNISIIEIKTLHYEKLYEYINKTGLLINDCLIFMLMDLFKIEYIATFDNDFKHISVKNWFFLK